MPSRTDEAIHPFEFSFPDTELRDLRARVKATHWPDKETVHDRSQGTQLATIKDLARYWEFEYDWRSVEEDLRSVPHFTTEIDGLDIHFIHVRSRHEDALPLILTHGWPGSIIQQLKIIAPLTNPTEHGGDASDAFHLIMPSLPGYGFSGKPTETGWNPERIARAWAELMARLGYGHFAAQGGDWGAIITELMGVQAPQGLVGFHTNMAGAVPPDIDQALASGQPVPTGTDLTAEEQHAVEQLSSAYSHVTYASMMASLPQSLTALADSPAGLAAFMLDPGLELIPRAFGGESDGLTRDDVLDNITFFWLTNTAISAARLYAENRTPFFSAKGVTLPVAVSAFPGELYQPPRSWAERAYPHLVHYNQPPRGGHFPAWEQPAIFVDEVRTGLRSLRP
ncbi:epoxide hydrolase family protein [Streptomyces sp. NBC_01294]|uniref:epoxide hydrolase family protein n=1 Tax=Streptomyces sp. NBC_01294 TaxID=2903815 RepID=UPI002DDC0539|nr:epoxide hydrolase [Streptomyces sp. NBC_01294]WRZ60555.1 epoxide hydrolase [Streptomyces sp. NBC_01294]